jgi:hypothetical protein
MLHQEDSVVTCYGCGKTYTVMSERRIDVSAESRAHCQHVGDTGLSREQLLNCINDLQAERDDWIKTAFGVEG